MFKRPLLLILALFVINLSLGSFAYPQVQDDKAAQRERDAEILVNKLGVGEKSLVVVKVKNDKKSIKGYLSEINDESFVITDKQKNTTTVQFSSVQEVSKDRSRSYRALAIGGGVLLGFIVICGLLCRD